jgi:signal transduction histidine kinase
MTPLREEALNVLLVEDSPSDAALLDAALTDAGAGRHAVWCVQTIADAVALAGKRPFDAILLDLTLPDCTGLETVDLARAAWPDVAIVVLTGINDEAMGIAAVRHGVQDFLVKGLAGGALIARALRYAVARQRAESEIRRMNRELEQRVEERTTQLRQLALEVTLVEQRERRRLAELLHDNLQQMLVFARLGTGLALNTATDPGQRGTLERVERSLVDAIEVARSLTAELSPPSLYSHGLAAAVRGFAGRLRELGSLDVTVVAEEGAKPRLEGQRALLFQSVRELLTNVLKHAGAAAAVVRIDRAGDDGIRVEVHDEGRGFAPGGAVSASGAGGFGLFGIRERLRQLGGACEVRSAPGGGTTVTLTLPGCLGGAGEPVAAPPQPE